MSIADMQLEAAAILRDQVAEMVFAPPVARVYNPLFYAWEAFAEYVARYGATKKRALFLGMNPGPWGMAQTGVPFGEVAAVRDWLKISAPIERPRDEHPGYPVDGYACRRSEVSGRRLWGLFKDRFGSAESFFQEHFVVNYCPLFFIETPQRETPAGRQKGRNLTPDKLPLPSRKRLYDACDAYLRALVDILAPSHLVGVGAFAASRAGALAGALTVSKILHPSPASPKSNSGWGGEATRQLIASGVWSGNTGNAGRNRGGSQIK